jgi:exodeoxyribonuclease-3
MMRPLRSNNSNAHDMKIATFNINNINKRLPVLLGWLRHSKPDVVCLQELKCLDRDFPEGELTRAGYGAVWRGQKTWNGVAILARGAAPILTRAELPGDPSDTQSRYIEAAIDGLLIGCLYAPNGNPQPGPKFQYKLAWMARLARHSSKLLKSGAPVVLAGDYNVVPTPFDIYPTKSWDDDALVQPESRAALRKIIDQGWVDALRTRHPKEPMYTFWHYWRNSWKRNAGLRIDHLLLSPAVAKRLRDAGVDTSARDVEGSSDHAPAWITLGDRSTRAKRKQAAPRKNVKKRVTRKA